MIIRIVKHFGTSLLFGCRYIYQSMPRMLSLWLEFGTTVAELERSQKGTSSRHLQENLQKTLTYLHTKVGKQTVANSSASPTCNQFPYFYYFS